MKNSLLDKKVLDEIENLKSRYDEIERNFTYMRKENEQISKFLKSETSKALAESGLLSGTWESRLSFIRWVEDCDKILTTNIKITKLVDYNTWSKIRDIIRLYIPNNLLKYCLIGISLAVIDDDFEDDYFSSFSLSIPNSNIVDIQSNSIKLEIEFEMGDNEIRKFMEVFGINIDGGEKFFDGFNRILGRVDSIKEIIKAVKK